MNQSIVEKATPKKPFSKWLQTTETKDILYDNRIKLKQLEKIRTEIFVVNNLSGEPLCIFEIARDSNTTTSERGFLLNKLSSPIKTLNLPGYSVLFEREGHYPITNFHVKKLTPTRRLVGIFNARDFAKFLATTAALLGKQKGTTIASMARVDTRYKQTSQGKTKERGNS